MALNLTGSAVKELYAPILNQSAIFVGCVIGFLDVSVNTTAEPLPGRLDIILDLEMVESYEESRLVIVLVCIFFGKRIYAPDYYNWIR
jgi:hypothetical protein